MTMNSYNSRLATRVSRAIDDFELGRLSLEEVQNIVDSAASLFENDGTGLRELARVAEADMERIRFAMLRDEQRPAAIFLLDTFRAAMESHRDPNELDEENDPFGE